MEQLLTARHAFVQCTGIRGFPIICRHFHALPEHVLLPDDRRIDSKLLCQLVDRSFQCKNALGRSVAPIGTCCHRIGIYNIIAKPECLQASGIKRNRFVSAQSYRRRTMLAISTGIG